jgi:tripartite-type tricarboxylate transporter receptor subunit TctC
MRFSALKWKTLFIGTLAANIISLIAAVSFGPRPAAAAFPERNIVLIVPFAAGGTTDIIARLVGEQMAKALGQSIVIENDTGAGGTIASRRVAQAAPDGYTLVAGTMGTHGAAPSQYPNLKYDPVQDFTPIGQTAGMPFVIATRRDFPGDTLMEFVEYIRRNQDKVNEAHAGVGSETHTACTLLQHLMGTKTARVAYRGGAPAINDLVAGQVDFGCTILVAVAPQVQAGNVKALAVTGPERAELIKGVPTTREAGLPQFQPMTWNALFGPRNLPQDIQTTLNAALDKALDDAGTRKRMTELGARIPDRAERTPTALSELVRSEVARWASVLKQTDESIK